MASSPPPTESERLRSFQERHADELGVGRYTVKKIREIVVSVGSLLLGGGLGYMAGKWLNRDVGVTIQGERLGTSSAKFGAGIGGFVGFVIGGIVLAYEHWLKAESTKLAVAEINDDISKLKIRQPVNAELVEENDRLREMLQNETSRTAALQSQSGGVQATIGRGERGPLEHATTAAQAPASIGH